MIPITLKFLGSISINKKKGEPKLPLFNSRPLSILDSDNCNKPLPAVQSYPF